MKTIVITLALSIGALSYGADEKPTEKADKPVTKIFEQSVPKPLGAVPFGWKLDVLKGHFIKQQPVELPNGETSIITTNAYVLIPEDKPGTVVLIDPGFDAALGSAQQNTVGAVLTAHVESADALSKKLDTAINALKIVLDAQPSPAPTPTEKKGRSR